MDDAMRDLVAALHQAPGKYAVALTGGGAGLAGRLLAVPGGSRSVVEVVVPYAEEALCAYLGMRPASFCSAETSRLLARRAAERARWLAPGANVLGLGLTAGLRSDRPKRGEHRCHVAIHTARGMRTWSLTLQKEARSRAEEETLVEVLALNALAEGRGVGKRIVLPLLEGDVIHAEADPEQDTLAHFLAGRLGAIRVEMDGRLCAVATPPKLLLPGSFNPLHEGHCELLQTATQHAGVEGAFELTVVNADKPPLDDEEVRRRLAQFVWRAPLWLTRAPTFVEKARLFPGAVFVVGADTAARIVQPRFYGEVAANMTAALTEFGERGCGFLVAGRVDGDGRFISVEDLAIPPAFRPLFTGLPFRRDISATQLRARTAQG